MKVNEKPAHLFRQAGSWKLIYGWLFLFEGPTQRLNGNVRVKVAHLVAGMACKLLGNSLTPTGHFQMRNERVAQTMETHHVHLGYLDN